MTSADHEGPDGSVGCPRPPVGQTGAASAGVVATRLRAAGCVFAEEEAATLLRWAGDEDQLQEWVHRRVTGEPLEHVVGRVDFSGHAYRVGPGTFVPRRRSELLVDRAAAAALTRPDPSGPVLLVEMCCGCGAIGLAAARALTAAGRSVVTLLADIDDVPLQWARRNAADQSDLDVQVHRGDLWSALPTWARGRVDVVIANAPYVPSGEVVLMPTEARVYEPLRAVDGGPDGLDLHRRLARSAPEWLRSGGAFVVETSDRQASDTAGILADVGLAVVVDRDDERGATVVTGHQLGEAEAGTRG